MLILSFVSGVSYKCIRACVFAALYGISDKTRHPDLHGMLFDAGNILTAINAFTLCLSLNHQRKYPGN